MIPRKKRIAIIVTLIILVVLIICGILGFLYLKTDAFKSNETLFAKYLIQNLNTIEILKEEDNSQIQNTLNTNKYTSKIEGNIEYTENIGTSNENKNNSINNIKLKINSNVDKANSYDYKDVSIENGNEKVLGFEYLNQNQSYGVRLKGIKQFVSIENNDNDKAQELGIDNLEGLTSKIDIASVLNFSKEEKQTLKNKYLGILQSNISKDKYYKQSNALITVNNKDVQTNAYYLKITVEEYNNLIIKILEQIKQDEIVLAKIDLIENEIKEKDSNYDQNESLREDFIKSIDEEIEKIKDKNIGNDEVRIVVYENNSKTVRTSIEKNTNKINIDLYNGSSIKISNVEVSDNTNEQFIKIEKNNNETQSSILVEYEKLQDNEIVNDIKLNYQQTFENNKLAKTIKLGISNQSYEGILNIVEDTQVVQNFENEVTLDTDNVKLDDLQEEQVNTIKGILSQNIQSQLNALLSVVSLEDCSKMLQNLSMIKKTSVELPEEGEVTEIEKSRFNSQFEFFVSENLTTDNIKELIKTTENNFENMKIFTKNNEVQDLDMEKLEGSTQESDEYRKNISEILIYIKQNSNNEEKQNDVLKYLEKNNSNKYKVSIEYDDRGLTRIIRAKIQED